MGLACRYPDAAHNRPVRRRPDGKPVIDGGPEVSAAHAAGMTLAVAAPEVAGCDLEPVADRPESVLRDLLGAERLTRARLVTREAGEPLDVAALRVWAGAESLRHGIGFEETNLVGNVYYANYIRWQGRCREMFQHDHVPEMLQEMADGLALVTVRCACDFFAELFALDEVAIRMRLSGLAQNRVTMQCEYLRVEGGAENWWPKASSRMPARAGKAAG